MKVSIITYNVLFNKASHDLHRITEQYRPDILCLQEVLTSDSNLKKIEELNYRLADHSNSFIKFGEIYGVATFYNPQTISYSDSKTFFLPRTIYEVFLTIIRLIKGGNQPRTVLRTDFVLKPAHKKITVYNTHLTALAARGARTKQLKEIFDYAKTSQETPLVIAGDFNSFYGKKEIEKLFKNHHLSEATRHIYYTFDRLIWKYNLLEKILTKIFGKIFSRFLDRSKLDYIFFRGLKLKETKRIDVRFSDHYPIICTFEI